MNEMTWHQVRDWEQLHCTECQQAMLLRFQGRPHDLRSAQDSSGQLRTASTVAMRRVTARQAGGQQQANNSTSSFGWLLPLAICRNMEFYCGCTQFGSNGSDGTV